MKIYELNGKLYRFADDKVPEGAILHGKKEPKKEEPEVKKKAPANKAKKPANKKAEAKK